jgi:hypothetical protein
MPILALRVQVVIYYPRYAAVHVNSVFHQANMIVSAAAYY